MSLICGGLRAAVFVAVAAIAISGCTANGDTGTPVAGGSSATTPSAFVGVTPSAAPTSQPVPDSLRFAAATIDGQPFDGAALVGKPVVLWFWAAWCSKCRAKAPDVAAIQRDFAGKVPFVGVAGLRSGDTAMKRFAADTGISGFPHLADDSGTVWKKFGVTTQEYFILIGRDGQIIHKGPLSTAELRQRVSAMAG